MMSVQASASEELLFEPRDLTPPSDLQHQHNHHHQQQLHQPQQHHGGFLQSSACSLMADLSACLREPMVTTGATADASCETSDTVSAAVSGGSCLKNLYATCDFGTPEVDLEYGQYGVNRTSGSVAVPGMQQPGYTSVIVDAQQYHVANAYVH